MMTSEQCSRFFELQGVRQAFDVEKNIDEPWTMFVDMNTGGKAKEPWARIHIKGVPLEAVDVFIFAFGHLPAAESCDCCGPHYLIAPSTVDAREHSSKDELILVKEEE